ncbi:hypothetical protein RJ640_002713 [Escallonia rubra]|uniref:Trichome birefringence-like N-terminal domain-containing protein n=1 Tax=Escallonia rubra TaxID=112253 RepID=A0AA88UQ68_9ASTE|nr:hypothetical protein RJ640_002713 [Escallonia rubra]
MGSTSPFKEKPHSFRRKLLPWTLYACVPILLIRLYFYPLPLSLFPADQINSSTNSVVLNPSSSSASASSPTLKVEEKTHVEVACDYTNGEWVHDKKGPLYNGTNCGTVKVGRNCMSHGRPDVGYLNWRWRPKQCRLPRFEPNTFLQLMRNKNLAFVGDSLARNQLESLLCMLATASTPNLFYANGEENKFRKWHFPSHNINVSIYWSPFLVKGTERSDDKGYNTLYLDSVDERWASEMDHMDMVVLYAGHWYLLPAVYHYENSVLGCHYCPGLNHTEIGFFDVFGKAIKTTLKAITERRGPSGNQIGVIVTTFSPAHFEGEWDKFGACPKTKPYEEGEKQLEGMNADMRNTQVQEVDAAKEDAKRFANLRLEALDVTKLALMRPDGHPGPYMHPFPFANGVSERMQNDCVHWCLPGPIDTWNEILLDIMKRWEGQSRRER